jgi:hypothetical protein
MIDEDKPIKKGLSELTEVHNIGPECNKIITERLRTENELYLKEELYRTILENSPS